VSSVEDVPQAIAAALGITSTSGDVLAQVTHALARTDMVLVLDNFEHVLGAVDVVSRVLDTCPGVKVLVTSRVRLGLQPEWLFPLEGLGYPQQPGVLSEITGFEAVTLFLERARRVKPSFQVTAADAPVLARLCSSLEGVPLAIELAASWARALPLEAIERDVSQNLDALISTATDGVRRHASIRATFEQSWSFLTEAEQGALMRLAVFRSSVSPSAARFVAGASNVLLAALVDKSLLRLQSNGRYALHPLLRTFSLEKLRSFTEDHERAERRHAAYYLRFLRERTDAAKGPNPAPVVAEIDAEISEILGAVRAAHERGKRAQLVAFMRLLTADTGYLPARDYGSGWLVLMTAAADAAVENGWLNAAHILKGRVGDAYLALGEPRKALPWYREAADLAHEDGDDREVIHLSLAGVTRSMIDGTAHSDLDVVLDRARAEGNDFNLAVVLEQRAYVEAEFKDAWDMSRALHLEVLDVVDRVERQQGATTYWIESMRYHALLNLGILEQHQGRLDDAMDLLRRAFAIAETSGNTLFIAGALGGLGEVHAALGDADLAREHFVRQLKLLTEINALGDVQQLVTRASTLGIDISSTPSEG